MQTGRNQQLESGEQDWIHHILWWLPFACPQSMLQPVLAGSAPNHSAHWNRTQTNKVKQEFGNIFSQYSFPPYSSLSLSSCMSSSNSFCCFSITKLSVVCNRCIHWMSCDHTNVSEIAWLYMTLCWCIISTCVSFPCHMGSLGMRLPAGRVRWVYTLPVQVVMNCCSQVQRNSMLQVLGGAMSVKNNEVSNLDTKT